MFEFINSRILPSIPEMETRDTMKEFQDLALSLVRETKSREELKEEA